MLEQLRSGLAVLWRGVRPRARRTVLAVLLGLRALWSMVRPPLLFTLQVVAALIVLFEEWGWRPLSDALGRLAELRPLAAVERWIAGLSPYAALLVFALPTTLLLPLKFVAVWLLARGFLWSASALFVGAKLASTALIARIFMLTKPALMEIVWFRLAYDWFTPWKEALFATIRASFAWRYGRMVKTRVRLETKRAWMRLKPRLVAAWQDWGPWLDERLGALVGNARAAWRRLVSRLRLEADRIRHAFRRSWQRLRRPGI